MAGLLIVLVALLCWHTIGGKHEILEPRQYQFLIDINTTTLGELQTLPGIGPALAGSIVQYRDEHAPIYDFSEIMNVRGIGEIRHNNMKPFFTE